MSDRQAIVHSANFWYGEARTAQRHGDLKKALLCMENAFNHTENALAAVMRDRGANSAEEMRAQLEALTCR